MLGDKSSIPLAGQWKGKLSVDTQLSFPLAGERNAALISQHEVQFFGFAEEPAVRLCLQHANREDVSSGLQQAFTERIDARVLHPCAGADELPVDVRGVHPLH